MALDRVLSQEEIDSVFRNLRAGPRHTDPEETAEPYDFRRPDRIPKDQLRAIHLLHENFARALGSSLSAYLRAYVTVNLVSVEQLSFLEFSQCLPSPTVMLSLDLKPYDGNAVLEINPTLVFPILETVLGGRGKGQAAISREITEIEKSILDGITRIILRDLREAWRAVSELSFDVERHETEPQLLQILAPTEAVIAVSMEVRIGENAGMINLGVPSIIAKMLRQKFDQHRSLRKSESTEREQRRVLDLILGADIQLDVRLNGTKLSVENLLRLEAGDVLVTDHPLTKGLDLEIHGVRRFLGHVADNGRKLCFTASELIPPETGERDRRRPLESTVIERARTSRSAGE